MTIVYGVFVGRLQRLLEDPEGKTYDEELLLDAVRASIRAVTPWLPKRATTPLVSGSSAYVVPTDYLESEVVIDDDGKVVPRSALSISSYFGSNTQGNSWIPFPHGYITFAKELEADYTLYYLSNWTLPGETVQATDTLELPDIAETGLLLYAAAYAIMPSAVSIGEIRQFGTKTDSGNPEHNPLQRSVDFLLKFWRDEMKRLPAFQKVG